MQGRKDYFNWCFLSKPKKIADSNFLGFKDWQQLKSAFFLGLSICQIWCSKSSWGLGEICDSPNAPHVHQSTLRFCGSALRILLKFC
ncbi:MAG: hypothetical protein LBS83_03340 [Holosporales bacterium]|nr:hypothetical protein [Holosporales bacterium]